MYVDEYNMHVGNHIYHATFPSASQTGVYLNVTGGSAFGYSAWLNGGFIGSYLGSVKSATGKLTLSFANATLAANGTDNVLVVVMDNSGHDETSGAINARGIFNATLLGPDDGTAPRYGFSAWALAGTAGRESNMDAVRGAYNEGGLHAERTGAHLPGFPDSAWAALAPNGAATTLAVPGAGVRVFRAVVPLAVPRGLDVSLAFLLSAPGNGSSGSTFVSDYTNEVRVLLFVNGYQYGRFNPYIGNQVSFPVPTGILDYHGDNTIAVTVWSQSAQGAEVKVDWDVVYVHTTGYDMGFDAGYLRPAWTSERLSYA